MTTARERAGAAGDGPELVVLLHGLGTGPWVMAPLARRLRRAGFITANLAYPSRHYDLRTLARAWVGPAVARVVTERTPARVHWVGHSLGGQVIRVLLREARPERLGRVVLIASPSHGSEAADGLSRWRLPRWFFGPVLADLRTPAAGGSVAALGPADYELGVIAGTRSLDPWFHRWMPAPHDGEVSLASTHVTGERDHVALPASHTAILWRRETARLVERFLREGRFASGEA
jgi:pimeloyl-ACP methyl ester carboxylesterase